MTMPTGELDQAVAQAEVGITEAPATVEGRSLWALAWRRIRRSKVAMASLGFIVFLILLIARNTRHVKLDYVFGSTKTGLVWLVIISAITGWVLGIVTAFLIRRRTRPRQPA